MRTEDGAKTAMEKTVDDKVERWVEYFEHVTRVDDEIRQMVTVAKGIRPHNLDKASRSLAQDEEEDDKDHDKGDASLTLASPSRGHHEPSSSALGPPVRTCHQPVGHWEKKQGQDEGECIVEIVGVDSAYKHNMYVMLEQCQ